MGYSMSTQLDFQPHVSVICPVHVWWSRYGLILINTALYTATQRLTFHSCFMCERPLSPQWCCFCYPDSIASLNSNYYSHLNIQYVGQLNSSSTTTLIQIWFVVALLLWEAKCYERNTGTMCYLLFLQIIWQNSFLFFLANHLTYDTTAKCHSVLSCALVVLNLVIFHEPGLLKHLLMNSLRAWYTILTWTTHIP